MYAIKYFLPITLLFLAASSVTAQKVFNPFPQHVHYFDNVIKPNHIPQQQLDDSVASFYKSWKGRYLKRGKQQGEYYIGADDAVANKKCVSEGQGYGMVIVSLMAGFDTAAQTIYNGLFNYYKLHPSNKSRYLMAWAQDVELNNIDESSASDGDIDIAYSLLLADAQWGNNGSIHYHNEALAIIAAIKQQEINPITFSILLSNAIEKDSKDYFDMRSSDFIPAHFKAFEMATKDSFWNKVIDNNYTLFNHLQNNYSIDAGLLPDFIQHIHTNAIPAHTGYLESKYDGDYNYNACRVPWRIATDFILNGDNRSKEIIEKINEWICGTTQNNPDNISAGYTLEGDDLKNRNFEAMSFVTSFAVAAMVEQKRQVWLNKLWDYIIGFKLNQYDYYDNTIKLFNLIILSGNYWSPSK